MAFPSNTLATYEAIGNREDLSDKIYKIATTLRPFQQNIKKGTAKATFHEWQTSTLRTPVATNKAVQGDDTTATAAVLTVRLGNRSQIFKEAASVTGTQQAVDTAGRPNEMSFQILYKGENLVNDMEMSLLANLAAITGADTTAPQLAGALAWMASNVSRGAGGSSGTYSGGQGAATNGTQRAFTETLLKTVLASAFTNGASGPKLCLMSATAKQTFSTFTGIADIRKDVLTGMAQIVGAADTYVSDFGSLTTVAVQFGLTRDVFIIDPAYWSVDYIRPMNTMDLATTGDSKRKQILAECTLAARNEKSSCLIADIL